MQGTRNGIRLMILLFILSIISSLIALLGFYDVFGGGEISSSSLSSLGSTVCFSAIIAFIGFLVFLLALYNLVKDSSNISASHDSSVKLALFLYIVGLFAGFLLKPLQTIFYTFGAVFLVKELGEDLERKLLWSAAGINILFGTTLSVFLLSMVKRELSSNLKLSIIIWFIMALLSGYGLFIITYRRINKKLSSSESEKFFSGEENRWESNLKSGYEECPNCGMHEVVVYDDRSAECLKCGYTTMEWEGNDEK